MSDHIPQAVLANILIRLRVKDLVSCRRVSKQWLSIIDNPNFVSRQLDCAVSTNTKAAIFLQGRSWHDLFWKKKFVGGTRSFSNPILRLFSPVFLIGSCHGLVCFSGFVFPHDFVIVNPSSGEQHRLSNPSKEGKGIVGHKPEAYGFGYDELSDDYKVVMILETSWSDPRNRSYIAEIYGIRSKVFTTIPLPNAEWRNSDCKSIGVFFGGSLHWCTMDSCNFARPIRHVIHAIDLASNTYRQLQFPETICGQVLFVNVGIVDIRLCLCGYERDSGKIGIWVMDEYGNLESLNKIYSIEYFSDPSAVTSVGSDGDKILMRIDWGNFAWYDPTKDEYETISMEDMKSRTYEAIYCLESLVKILPSDVKKDASDTKLADQKISQKKSRSPAFLEPMMQRDDSSDEEYCTW